MLPLRVYIEDTDAGGIVYYVNYLKYMERARTELMRTLGYHKPAILDEGLLLVVHSAQVNYLRPAKLDDAVTVSAGIARVARTYMVFHQRVCRAEQVLCEGDIKVACVKNVDCVENSMKPAALPREMYQVLNEYAESVG